MSTKSTFPVVSAGAYHGDAQIGDLNGGGVMEAEVDRCGSPNPLLMLYVGGTTLQIIMSEEQLRAFAKWLMAHSCD